MITKFSLKDLLLALRETGNNRTQAAKLLGVNRRSIYARLTTHQLTIKEIDGVYYFDANERG